MELKKNDRIMYEDKVGTVMENPFRVHSENESYADVLFDGCEFWKQIKVKNLRKVHEYEVKTRCKCKNKPIINKLHNLKIYEDMKTSTMFNKLNEEVDEVRIGLINHDIENIAEELLDIMQCCLGIAYTKKIDLNDYIEKHNEKLLSRNHEFI